LRPPRARGAVARDDDHRPRLFRASARDGDVHALDDPWLDHARRVREISRPGALEGGAMSATNAGREELERRIEAIGSGCGFMLAYAATGRPTDKGPGAGGRVREHLEAMARALDGLGVVVRAVADADPHGA